MWFHDVLCVNGLEKGTNAGGHGSHEKETHIGVNVMDVGKRMTTNHSPNTFRRGSSQTQKL